MFFCMIVCILGACRVKGRDTQNLEGSTNIGRLGKRRSS